MLANYSVSWSAVLSALAGNVTQYYAACRDSSGKYVTATTANRLASPSGRSEGIFLAAGTADNSVPIAFDGVFPAGLGTGAITPCVVDSVGRLTRKASPVPGDDVIGTVFADGSVRLQALSSAAASSWPYYWVDITWSTYGAVADADGFGGGTNCSAAITAAMQSLDANTGPLVIIPPGRYRIAPYATAGTGVAVNRVTRFKGTHPGQNFGGTILYVDAGCTGFDVLYSAGQDTVFEDITIAASGKRATTGAGATYTPATKTITLAAAGDFVNGQAIRIPGAGGLLDMSGTLFQATGGTTVLVSGLNVASAASGGFHIGDYVVFGAGFLTRTRINSITYDGSNNIISITMARAASAVDPDPVTPKLAGDVIAQIQSGGGTTTLIVDVNGDVFGGGPASWAGTITALDLSIYHADSGIYAKANITARDCVLGGSGKGFAGAGIVVRGSASVGGGDIPQSNANLCRLENIYFIQNAFGVFASGTDANVCVFDQCKSGGSVLWSFVDAGGLGSGWRGCHADGGYGWLTGPSPGTAVGLNDCYLEVGTISFLGDGTAGIQGTMPLSSGGTILQGSRWNRMFCGDVTHYPTFFTHEFQGDPTRHWWRLISSGSPAAGFIKRKSTVAGDGVANYAIELHESATAGKIRYTRVTSDHGVAAGPVGVDWYPEGFMFGGGIPGDFTGLLFCITGRRSWFSAGASPTTNGMLVGSRCYNDFSNGANNAIDFWRCTVSGSPDTWVAFP